MTKKTIEQLAQEMPDLSGDWEYLLEGLKIDLAAAIKKQMKAKKIHPAYLATRLHIGEIAMNRILQCKKTMTLPELAKIAIELDMEIGIRLVPSFNKRKDEQ